MPNRALLIAAVLFMASTGIAYCRWDDLSPADKAKFGGLTDKQFAFVKTRHSKSGLFCCDDADGYQPDKDDVAWDMHNGKYRVRIRGEWVDVSDDANIVGRAVVWMLPSLYTSNLTPTQYGTNPIRCARARTVNLKPTIQSLQRLRQDADKNLMPDLAAVYAQSLERLIRDDVAWDAYCAAFQGSFIPKRNGGIDA
jgi:hypothetical protein